MHAHLYFARVARVTPRNISMCRFNKQFTASVHGFYQIWAEGVPTTIALAELSDGAVVQLDVTLYDIEFTGAIQQLVAQAQMVNGVVLPPGELHEEMECKKQEIEEEAARKIKSLEQEQQSIERYIKLKQAVELARKDVAIALHNTRITLR